MYTALSGEVGRVDIDAARLLGVTSRPREAVAGCACRAVGIAFVTVANLWHCRRVASHKVTCVA